MAPVGCSGNLASALSLDGSFRVVLTFLSGADYNWVGSVLSWLFRGFDVIAVTFCMGGFSPLWEFVLN